MSECLDVYTNLRQAESRLTRVPKLAYHKGLVPDNDISVAVDMEDNK
jgi:hypothetical protein